MKQLKPARPANSKRAHPYLRDAGAELPKNIVVKPKAAEVDTKPAQEFVVKDQGPRPLNAAEREREKNANIPTKVDPEITSMSEFCKVYNKSEKDVMKNKGYDMADNWYKIGSGGFGTVYKGFRKSDGKMIAVKEIKYDTAAIFKGFYLNLAYRELKHMRMLKSHENIIQLIDVFAVERKGWDSKLYAILEYANAGDLYDYMAKFPEQRLPYQEARRVFRDICYGLNFIHGRRLAHLDIKCGNILLVTSKQNPKQVIPKITDFGLSLVAWTPADGIIPYSEWPGTFEYLAPEALYEYWRRPAPLHLHSSISMVKPGVEGARQLKLQRPSLIGELMGRQPKLKKKTPIEFFKALYLAGQNPLAVDIWALGVVLFVMVTSNYPFRVEDSSRLDLILRGKFIRYHFIPQDLAEFLKTMLTPMPAKRATIRCVLDHDWMKEGRNVQLYIPKEKPINPPAMRNKTKSDPTLDKKKGDLAKAMGTVIEGGGYVEPGHKVVQVPAAWTKEMLEGWKAQGADVKDSEKGGRKKTEPPPATAVSPTPGEDGSKNVSPITSEGKKVIAEMSAMSEEERQRIIQQYDEKHGPYKPDPKEEAALDRILMDMPAAPHAKKSATDERTSAGSPSSPAQVILTAGKQTAHFKPKPESP